jgi:hypothetical protein
MGNGVLGMAMQKTTFFMPDVSRAEPEMMKVAFWTVISRMHFVVYAGPHRK